MGLVTKTLTSLTRRADFTHAQVLAWPTTPLVIIPFAPPTGHAWVAGLLTIWLNPFLAGYTNIDGAAAMNSGPTGSPFNFPIGPNSFLGGNKMESAGLVWEQDGSAPNPFWSLTMTNGALGNFTGGNAANVFHVQIHFWNVVLA